MPLKSRAPAVYSIPPDLPFLATLAQKIINGTLLPEGFDTEDPLAFADLTIYLPTRRAARLLAEHFRDAAANDIVVLPRIKALGEVDPSEDVYPENDLAGDPAVTIPPAIEPLSRQIILTKLILAWGEAMGNHRSGTPLMVPASPADASYLAADLGDLMDRATSERVPWARLGDLVPDDYANYWQLTLDFLKIATENWPQILSVMGRIDAAERRDRLIAAEARRLEGRDLPVIAAGSTGTLPSTADFLTMIAHKPNGAVVLPGLDMSLEDDVFDAIGGPTKPDEAINSHPQYGMKRLLSEFIGIKRGDVGDLSLTERPLENRTRLMGDVMLPAPRTDLWGEAHRRLSDADLDLALADIALIEAETDTQEALAIACALRTFIETDRSTACLVTPDRSLARRVALELNRWGLSVDDSAGRPLAKTPPAVLAQLIAETVLSELDPVKLLALLKHPMAVFGMEPGEARRAARILDLAVLRAPRISGGSTALLERVRAFAGNTKGGTEDDKSSDLTNAEGQTSKRRLHPAIETFTSDDYDLALRFCEALKAVLTPLETLFERAEALPLSEFAEAHKAAFSAIVGKDQTATRQLFDHFDALASGSSRDLQITAFDYPPLFRALLSGTSVPETGQGDHRLLILGVLEARLLSPDLIVLGGLDEGSWPRPAETDAFMSRGMRAVMGLEAPERRIGLSAHDVVQSLGTKKVILSRARKRSGSPQVRSRWLQRLTAVIGKAREEALLERGSLYLDYAGALDQSKNENAKGAERPNPKPPVSARPNQLSVTRIETWVRDPYAIYCERILNMRPIDPLGAVPDFATRGNLVHQALDRFIAGWDGPFDETAKSQLLELGSNLFKSELKDFPEIRAAWWPRFQRLAQAFVAFEAGRDHEIIKRHTEVFARLAIPVDGLDFFLTAEADRIDERTDGTLSVIDFKTGDPPNPKQVKSGLAAQLALETAMIQAGAFDFLGHLSNRSVAELGWLKLDGLSDEVALRSAVETPKKDEPAFLPDDLGALALEQITSMIRAYRNPDQGYMSRPRVDFQFRHEGPFDHLARVKEWLAAEEGEA
ncbi:MAG: double-strand break repair protein AddB [Pseudomonadota bacterium]